MYLSDYPIKKSSQDMLNRSYFAEVLAKSLISADAVEGYTVGLYGPWGSGKSSIINMVCTALDIIKEKSQTALGLRPEKFRIPVVIHFNPWNFTSTSQLLQQFLKQLSNTLASYSDKKLHDVYESISEYSDILDALGTPGKIVKDVSKSLQKKNILNGTDLFTQKINIETALFECNYRIIVIIDDIDRLRNKDIRRIFQLVASVAKFPNIVYLLAFDKDIVCRALDPVQDGSGEQYIEKIIQVPINIPMSFGNSIWKILDERLEQLRLEYRDVLFDHNHWEHIFSVCVQPYIVNIRDIIRLVNNLNVKMSLIKENLNYVDLIAISVIEIKCPKLFEWIKNNKGLLVGSLLSELIFENADPGEAKKYYLEKMQSIDPEDSEKYLEMLLSLFPYVCRKMDIPYSDLEDIAYSLSIGHKDYFYRYFTLAVDPTDVTQMQMREIIVWMDENEISDVLEKLKKNEGLIHFLNALSRMLNDIEEDRVPFLARVLMDNIEIFRFSDYSNDMSPHPDLVLKYKIQEMLPYIKSPNDLEVVKKCYEKTFNEAL